MMPKKEAEIRILYLQMPIGGLGTRVYYAPNKQNGTCLDVADQEDKGTINGDLDKVLYFWYILAMNVGCGNRKGIYPCGRNSRSRSRLINK